MTTIAWDGVSLAGDKQLSTNGWKSRGTKVQKAGKYLLGYSGPADAGVAMLEWFVSGHKKETFPAIQANRDTNCTLLVVDTKHKAGEARILRYDCSPSPLVVEEPRYAIGTGREIALTAMFLGKTAEEAIEVASLFDDSTGMGVDVLVP